MFFSKHMKTNKGYMMDETTTESIKIQEVNKIVLEAKVAKLAPTKSFLPEKRSQLSIRRLHDCSFATFPVPQEVNICTVSDATQFAKYLYRFSKNLPESLRNCPS